MPSSVISCYAYDAASRSLTIDLVSGARYRYHDVPQTAYEGLRRASSRGNFYNLYIKPFYAFTRLEPRQPGGRPTGEPRPAANHRPRY